MNHIDSLAEKVFVAVNGYVDKCIEAVVAKVTGLEATMSRQAVGLCGLSDKLQQLESFVDNLPAPKDGIDGKDGANGADGKDGENGKDGSAGLDGLKGTDGQDGRDGVDGQHGKDGRDALEIEPLTMIEQERSYPRGTWAHHNGGLIRAARHTDPLGDDMKAAGWDVMVEGLAGVSVKQEDDLRTLVVATQTTSGKSVETKFYMPIPIYKGLPKDESKQADMVTWDGHTWHCNFDTTDKPAYGNPAWTLAAKRGKDGSDAGYVAAKTADKVRIK